MSPLPTISPAWSDFMHLCLIYQPPQTKVFALPHTSQLHNQFKCPAMLMPSWCGHRGFLIYQSLRENAGGGKSEEPSFLASPRDEAGEGESLLPLGRGEGRPCRKWADAPLPAPRVEGRRTCSHPPSRLDLLPRHLPRFANWSFTSYVMAEERRQTNMQINGKIFFLIHCGKLISFSLRALFIFLSTGQYCLDSSRNKNVRQF